MTRPVTPPVVSLCVRARAGGPRHERQRGEGRGAGGSCATATPHHPIPVTPLATAARSGSHARCVPRPHYLERAGDGARLWGRWPYGSPLRCQWGLGPCWGKTQLEGTSDLFKIVRTDTNSSTQTSWILPTPKGPEFTRPPPGAFLGTPAKAPRRAAARVLEGTRDTWWYLFLIPQ